MKGTELTGTAPRELQCERPLCTTCVQHQPTQFRRCQSGRDAWPMVNSSCNFVDFVRRSQCSWFHSPWLCGGNPFCRLSHIFPFSCPPLPFLTLGPSPPLPPLPFLPWKLEVGPSLRLRSPGSAFIVLHPFYCLLTITFMCLLSIKRKFPWYTCSSLSRPKKRFKAHNLAAVEGGIVSLRGRNFHPPPQKDSWNRHCSPVQFVCTTVNKLLQLRLSLVLKLSPWMGGRNVRRILVRGINAPLPPEAKKISKIWLRNSAFWCISE